MAGAFAGAVSRTATAPLDRLRVLLQVQIKQKHQQANPLYYTWKLCKKIYSDGGILSFWRGNGINILKIIPESAVRFYVYETTKQWIVQYHRRRPRPQGSIHLQAPEIGTTERMISGGLAGFASQLSIYPLETIKIRMMAEISSNKENKTSFRVSAIDVARKMWRSEGIRPFFRGIGPSLIGIVPYASIDLTVYETLKSRYISLSGNRQPSPVIHLVCGAIAGTMSATIVYPLGLIRTRLQAQGTSSHTVYYPRGTIDVILKTYREETIRGFYKGLVPTLCKVVPAVSLSYICYEIAKKHLNLN